MALFTRRHATWWAAVGFSSALIVLVAWSRVRLGVHWTSDVVASLFLCFVALSAAETWLSTEARPSHVVERPGPASDPPLSDPC